MAFFDSSIVATRERLPILPRCGACGLSEVAISPKIPVCGEGRKGILLIGSGPTKEDDQAGTHLSGDLRRIVESRLKRSGIDFERDCWRTGAVICRTEKSADPDGKQIKFCRPNLTQTLDNLKPKLVIVLGRPAVESLLVPYYREKVGELDTWVGWNIPSVDLNAWICPTYDPKMLIDQADRREYPALERWFDEHIRRACLLVDSRPYDPVPDYESKIKVILDPQEGVAWIDELIRSEAVSSFDYECNTLKPYHDEAKLLTVGIATHQQAVAMSMAHPSIRAAVKRYLASPIKKVGANTKFEDLWSRAHLDQVVNGFVWDCMLSAHHLDNRAGITSVKFQAFVRLGVSPWDIGVSNYIQAEDSSGINKLEECDLRTVLKYNAFDALYELMIADKQKAEMKWQNR